MAMRREELARSFASSILIINPSRYPQVSRILARIAGKIPVPEVVISRDIEHFREAVRTFTLSSFDTLLVWGGDGTAHEAINALMRARVNGSDLSNKAIGFLRGGSGNGIQDSYQVPYRIRSQLEAYATSMSERYTVDVDLIRVESSAGVGYAQLFGIGFDADVLARREAMRVGRGRRIPAGVFRYVSASLAAFRALRIGAGPPIQLTLERGKYAFKGTRVNAEFPFRSLSLTTSPVMIELGTRPYYGKLFKVCPDVVCNDGFMDVYVFDFRSKLSMLMNAGALWNGHHAKINKRAARNERPVIQRYEVEKVSIESDTPRNYHIDGELRPLPRRQSGYGVDVSVVPNALRFLVPASFYWIFHPFDGDPSATAL